MTVGKCGICEKEADMKYESVTTDYCWCKATNYYFCSAECMDKFNRTKKCRVCNSHSNLVETEDNFMVCTSKEYWDFSCEEKYNIWKKYNLPRLECEDDYYESYVNCPPDLHILRERMNEACRNNSSEQARLVLIELIKSTIDDLSYKASLSHIVSIMSETHPQSYIIQDILEQYERI